MKSFQLLFSLLSMALLLPHRASSSSSPSDSSTTIRPSSPQSCPLQQQQKENLAIILDVDNTLYCEDTIQRLAGIGIEEQIINNTHIFCQEHFKLSPQQADDLYHKYGTTIEGIRQEYPLRKDLLDLFYHQVYDSIDFTCLLVANKRKTHTDETGYSHAGDSLSSLRSFLSNIPYPLYLASNSPSWHVVNILKALGLSRVPWKGMLTPDTITHNDISLPFPTKAHPNIYYKSVLSQYDNCILVDDSLHNVKRAQTMTNMTAIHVNHNTTTLEQALNIAMGHTDPDYTLSDARYLQAKNLVDAQSIHAPTYEQVAKHVKVSSDGILRVVDVGAGLLSMLSLILKGQQDKKPLLKLMKQQQQQVKGMEYYAYEPNESLWNACREKLQQLGFSLQHETKSQLVYHCSNPNTTVYLKMMDYTLVEDAKDVTPNLIVGCCFADLMDPNVLVESLLRFTTNSSTLAYFPITFAGITQFLPPQPFGTTTALTQRRVIPSDTTAFFLYSDALTRTHGHNLDPNQLVSAMKNHGATLLHSGPSNWKICPTKNEYLWNTMLYFFGTVGAFELMKRGYDSVGWIHRARQGRPSMEVSNVDLLFRLGDGSINEEATLLLEEESK